MKAAVIVPRRRHREDVGRRHCPPLPSPRSCWPSSPPLSPRRRRPSSSPSGVVTTRKSAPAATLCHRPHADVGRRHRRSPSALSSRRPQLSLLSPRRRQPSSFGVVPVQMLALAIVPRRCPLNELSWPPSLSFSSVTAQTLAAIVPLRLCHCEGVGHRPSLLSFAVVPLKSSRPPSSPLSTAITAAPGCPLVANDVPSWPTMSPHGQSCPLIRGQ